MEVILIENIEKLGKVGDVVKVKDGYARNYLIPKKKVLRANKENLKVFDEKKSVIEAEEKKRKEKSEEIAKKISIGKLNKFKEENSLLSQPWVMEPKRKVKDVMNDLKISDLKIKDFYRLKIGE